MSSEEPDEKHQISEADREGDIDDDRQDAPKPSKTGSGEQLDGFRATPGDGTDEG